MKSSNQAFRVDNLTKTYQMGDLPVQALRGVNLDIRRGELIVLLGPSGSGKSTFLNILGGLDTPSSGQVWFEDHDLTSTDERALTFYRRDHVGFVFQTYNLVPSLTALEIVGLSDRAHHFPAQLSGGEQQRVAIARANRDLGTTVLLITHNANIALMADRVFHFADGRIEEVEIHDTRRPAREINW
jgi:putative ABC transport system ATP-binding protein